MLAKPTYKAKTIFEINYDQLKENGIKFIAFDLDSTVMKSKSGVFSKETIQLFENLKKYFKLFIISNNHRLDYIQQAASQVDFPVLAKAKKPCTKISKEFIKENNINIKEMVMVGDRPLTDILFGNILGCQTILVDSINWYEETKIVRIARQVERLTAF